jgi:hypothetical protein
VFVAGFYQGGYVSFDFIEAAVHCVGELGVLHHPGVGEAAVVLGQLGAGLGVGGAFDYQLVADQGGGRYRAEGGAGRDRAQD